MPLRVLSALSQKAGGPNKQVTTEGGTALEQTTETQLNVGARVELLASVRVDGLRLLYMECFYTLRLGGVSSQGAILWPVKSAWSLLGFWRGEL